MPTPPEFGGHARDFAPTRRFYAERAARIRTKIAEANAKASPEADDQSRYQRLYPSLYNQGEDDVL